MLTECLLRVISTGSTGIACHSMSASSQKQPMQSALSERGMASLRSLDLRALGFCERPRWIGLVNGKSGRQKTVAQFDRVGAVVAPRIAGRGFPRLEPQHVVLDMIGG